MIALSDNATKVSDLFDILLALSLENRKGIVDVRMTSEQVLTGAQADLMPAIESAQADLDKYFPSGIQMLFQQSAAPSGWKKLTNYTDCALRLTGEGTGSRTDGMAFSFCFAAARGTTTTQISMGVNGSTLSVGQLASHSHDVKIWSYGKAFNPFDDDDSSTSQTILGSGSGTSNATGWRGSNEAHGHGTWNTAHGHQIWMNVNFVDFILCEKG